MLMLLIQKVSLIISQEEFRRELKYNAGQKNVRKRLKHLTFETNILVFQFYLALL